jgi:hypothetical protein
VATDIVTVTAQRAHGKHREILESLFADSGGSDPAGSGSEPTTLALLFPGCRGQALSAPGPPIGEARRSSSPKEAKVHLDQLWTTDSLPGDHTTYRFSYRRL